MSRDNNIQEESYWKIKELEKTIERQKIAILALKVSNKKLTEENSSIRNEYTEYSMMMQREISNLR